MSNYFNDKNIIGKKFGRLTAIKRINDKGKAIYLCHCDCGNTVEVKGDYLQNRTHSCGCLKKEKSRELMENIKENGREELKKHAVDGTNTINLKQKTSKNNKTGVKGVSKSRTGKYRAYLTLKGKQIHLGSFETLKEAKEARKKAEEVYYKPYLNMKTDDNK
ncbi:hypothetical protein [Streptococcus pluranimalium]|uniref:hypothetical protein n=1 Tax=Streptococcus pluranimalium TaxID=82348 RepID=UPI0039FC3F50